MTSSAPRVLLTGTNSGCGKTTVTCAILKALCDRNLSVAAFKCGPDYIDTMFHSRITGAESSNLDPFFFSENVLNYLLAKNSAGRDISVIEGVMGYYDGLGITDGASTHTVAEKTGSPAVLTVNAKGAAASLLAEIAGFLDFSENSGIKGVIFNRCSPMLYPSLKEAVTERFGGRVLPLGYLPPMPDCSLESRHLGLVTAQEVENLREKLDVLSRQAEKSLDLDGLLALAASAPELSYEPVKITGFSEPVKIGVARDRAFCFYYEDGLDLLKEAGAELIYFSPLEDKALPEGLDGLILGGGYPELYAEKLSQNASMRASVLAAVKGGLPTLAECGGFMYLTESIGDFPMAGCLPGACFNTGKLSRFGYITLSAKKDNMLCRAGESIPAHEFHYWDAHEPGNGFLAEKPSGKRWDCCFSTDTLYAGFPHFHFYANPLFAENFYRACLKEKRRHV